MARIVGPCRGCSAKQVRETYVDIQVIRDALGERRVFVHTAIVRRNRTDPGRPCRGYVEPTKEYLNPAPQQHSIDAWEPSFKEGQGP